MCDKWASEDKTRVLSSGSSCQLVTDISPLSINNSLNVSCLPNSHPPTVSTISFLRHQEMAVNLKICLSTLLLFFLLGERSASAGILSLGKLFKAENLEIAEKIFKGGQELVQTVLEKLDSDRKKPSSLQDTERSYLHPPPQPYHLSLSSSTTGCTHSIKNLSLLKEYLSDYGYMDNSDQFTDCVDSEMVSAIKRYQQFFNLPITGQLDRATVKQLLLLRCGVPDINVTYHHSTAGNDGVSWPNGTEWFADRRSLTYGFHPSYSVPPNIKRVFSDSFQRWSHAIKVLNLTQTSSFHDADIKIGFYVSDGSIGAEVVGATIVQDVQGNNSFGYMVLDAEKYGLVPPSAKDTDPSSWENEKVDLETVVMHQIGHLLGLSHSSDVDSVMHPSVNLTTVELSNGDLRQIQRLYSSSDDQSAGGGGVASNHQIHSSGDGGIVIGSSWGLLVTLSLGFSAMVLFY